MNNNIVIDYKTMLMVQFNKESVFLFKVRWLIILKYKRRER